MPPPPHMHMHACVRAHTHIHAHAYAHTHTRTRICTHSLTHLHMHTGLRPQGPALILTFPNFFGFKTCDCGAWLGSKHKDSKVQDGR